MFAGTQNTTTQKELNTPERTGQDAAKITSAFADSCIQFLSSARPILLRMLFVFVFGFHELFALCCASFSSFVMMEIFRPHCVVKSDKWSLDDDRRREDCHCETIATSRHSINQELDEEIMKPEKGYQGAKKLRNRSEYHKNGAMVPGTRSLER